MKYVCIKNFNPNTTFTKHNIFIIGAMYFIEDMEYDETGYNNINFTDKERYQVYNLGMKAVYRIDGAMKKDIFKILSEFREDRINKILE
jgi:hypothetical protein